MTPAQRHRARALGQVAVTAANPAPVRGGAAASEYELWRAKLGVDLRRLHEIQSTEAKIELKRELAPEYNDWIDGVLSSEGGAEDDILTWNMIWRIDIGAFEAAMPLARYVLRHNLTLPDRFDRTAPTLICEQIAEAAIKQFGQGTEDNDETKERAAIAAMLRILSEVDDLVAPPVDIFDQVRAKLEKAQGLGLIRQVELTSLDADGPAGARRGAQERAARHLRRAIELDDTVGVKKRLEQLERAIRTATDG